jgi:RHS repeat-associated protein
MATFRLRAAHIAGLRKSRFAAGLQQRLQAEGKTTSYDPASSVVQSTDAVGRTFAYRLGADGFIDAVKSPAGRVSRLRCDRDGNLLEFVEPSGQTSQFSYAEHDVPTGFGRDGQPLCRFDVNAERTRNDVTFWDGSRASATFDAHNRPLSLTNRLGATERFSYDSQGRVCAFLDANGARTRFIYGANGRVARTLYPDGHSDFASYDPAGNVERLRTSGQRSLVVTSTPAGRPAEIKYPDATSCAFKYDGAGRVIAAESRQAASSYRYGDAGELLEETNGGHSFKFEYDPTGLLLSIEYPDQSRVAFEYDLDKRISRITDWSGAGTTFQRALDDRSEATRLPNGLETAVKLTAAGKPQRTSTRSTRSGAVLYETQAAFDVQGRVASLADSEFGKRDYSYDAESQLLAVRAGTGETLEWFSYDPAGNRVSNSGNRVELGSGNRLLSAWNARCDYDRHGNLSEAEWSGAAWRYTYDARNQLLEAEGPQGKVRFEYDAFGRRMLKESGASKTEYVWCGEQLAREIITTSDKRETRDYLYLPGTHTPFALRVDGHVYYYHCDHRGTPQRLTDADGRIVWAAEYSAFGQARVHVALIDNSLRFPGQHYDSETGLSYNRFRYYSAELGRYITPDPVGLLGGSNGYRYVGNDPLNKTDPLGLWWKAAVSVLAGVAVAAAIVLTAPVSLPLLAGAAVLGVAVGVGVDKALNIDHFCVPCIASAFASGFIGGLEMAAGFVVAAALFPEAATALAVGGAVVGCYAILAEHLGWPMPAGEVLDPSTWHMHSGKSFDAMTDAEKNASLGNLAGGTAGAVAGGALAEGVFEEPGVPPEEGPIGEEPIGEEPVDEEPVDEEPVDEEPVDEEPVDEEPVDEEPGGEIRGGEEEVEPPPPEEEAEPVDEEPAAEEDEAPKKGVQRAERPATDPEISPTTGEPVNGASKVVEYQDPDGNTVSRYYVDEQGRTVQAEGKLDPPTDYTKEGVDNIKPDGLQKGTDHRGHLIPERGAPDADAVNVPENVVAEHGTKSNQGPKRAWENKAVDFAEDDPGSTSVHQPVYDGDNPRPTSINHSLYDSDGNLVPGMSKNIPNPTN